MIINEPLTLCFFTWSRKRKEVAENYEDDTFYFISGYTSNGVPFGVTSEEMEIDEGKTSPTINKDNIIFGINDENLPF
jgi:hypothetical protein